MAEIYRIPFFPAGLPDETLHSRASRYHYMSGNLHDRFTLQDLFGSHTFAPTSNLPSHLLALRTRLPGQTTTTPDELIEEATLFPYFRPFLSKTQINACRQAMLGNNAGDLKITMGVVASRIGGDNSFRYCQSCVQADDHDHGIAYWHRAHQLPGVLVCPRHGEPLFELGHYWMKSHKHNLFLPSAPEVVSASSPSQIHADHIGYLTKIAIDSAALLTARQDMFERVDLNAHYRDRAQVQGWLGPGGRLRIDDVQQAAIRCMELLPQLKSFRFVATGEQWILKLMRKQRCSMHPLKHLVLLTLLQGDWEGMSRSCSSRFADRVKAPDRIRVDDPKPQADTERELRAMRLRPKFLKGAKLEAVRLALVTTDPLTSVAKAQCISLASIYRVLMRYPHIAQQRRERFQEMRRERFIGELKSIPARVTRDYMWLYRNDLDWLRRTIAARAAPIREPFTVIDWPARDENTALAVQRCAAQLYEQNPPVRVTKGQIAKATGDVHFIEKYITRLPKTHIAVKMVAETVENFQKRRLAWAANQLRERAEPLVAWRVLRLAGLKAPLAKELEMKLQQQIDNSGLFRLTQ